MIGLAKKMVSGVLGAMAGKKKYQHFFESMLNLSLQGMNIGQGGSTENSGERLAAEYVLAKLATHHENFCLFDVGANAGDYSLLLSEVFKSKAQIFAFEPSLKTYQRFLHNTQTLKNVKAHHFGFGNENTRITLFSNADESGLASLYDRRLDHFNIALSQKEDIELRTLDGFCTEEGIRQIHFLKLDVEGHELKVLEGAKELLKTGRIHFIQFEFGGCNIDSRTYLQDFYYLLKDQYQLYRIVKDGIYPITAYNEAYEAFKTTNYLAEKKN